MLRSYLAKRRVKKFLTKVAIRLKKDYGKKDKYTEGQVTTAIKSLNYRNNSEDMAKIAIAIWCSEEIAKNIGLDQTSIDEYQNYISDYEITLDSNHSISSGDTSGSD